MRAAESDPKLLLSDESLVRSRIRDISREAAILRRLLRTLDSLKSHRQKAGSHTNGEVADAAR